MIRDVLLYPHPFLKLKQPESEPSQLVSRVFEDLLDTLRHHQGCVGLAATQIGHPVRALVVDVSSSPRASQNHGLICLLNPVIVQATQWKVSREGCLSFPDLLADVKRAQKLELRGLDRNFAPVELATGGFEAVALQHEIDHLDGILFLDRIRSAKDLHERRKS